MIRFEHVSMKDRAHYEDILKSSPERGCEYSFPNLYMWGRQTMAEVAGCTVLFSQFNRRSVYPFPIGDGDVKAALDAVIHDAKVRGIPCRLTGLTASDVEKLRLLYGERFRIHADRDSHDYVYLTEDLAELKGKKYHRKRGHYKRFTESYPDHAFEVITEANRADAEALVERWYAEREAAAPDADFCMERCAMKKAFKEADELGLIGYALRVNGEICAVTFGSLSREDTVNVHFEKALTSVEGAYAAINRGFAEYIKENYPSAVYLNREDDVGIEGLRKAKLSYYPHHMIEKWWACLLEDGYDY
ncbi:MAG: DUF2156 domain-containing protein [Clostridia bacterium]|nr:DUF2156 domain-containing protein [Clostridia bacterium]MBQ9920596.1 DUF2156 domain-containing protein [Clostridia bacterium]